MRGHRINWDWLSKYDLYHISTPTDGNCLFHSILGGFYKPYQNHISMARQFRRELSEKLGSKNPKTGKIYYETINNGFMKEYSKFVPEYSLSRMKRELDSNSPLGYGYMEFIADIIDKDIYILDRSSMGLYKTDEVTVKDRKSAIIIYYDGSHYETVVQNVGDSQVHHFSSKNPIIKNMRLM